MNKKNIPVINEFTMLAEKRDSETAANIKCFCVGLDFSC